MRVRCVLTGTLAGVLSATQILAAESTDNCLQRNRLQDWRVVDTSTLVMTDVQNNQFTVRLSRRCLNLSRPRAVLTYRTWQNLACLHSGDIFRVGAPGLGVMTCSVASVEAGAPSSPAQ
jgi:ribosomal protein S14